VHSLVFYKGNTRVGAGKNKRLAVVLLIFVLVVNGVWYALYSVSRQQYRYRLDTMSEKVVKQKELIEKQEFIIEKYQEKNVLDVIVTAYTPRKSETDSTPEFTAIMSPSRPGYTAAVSRDLIRFLGRKIYIQGVGVFGLEDVMNRRYRERIDLMFGDVKTARKFGKKRMQVIVLSQFDEAFRPIIDAEHS